MTLLNDIDLGGKPVSVYLTEVSQDETVPQVVRRAYEVDQGNFVRAGLFVVRPFVGKQFSKEEVRKLNIEFVRDRAGDSPLHILYSRQYATHLSQNLNPSAAQHKLLSQDQLQELAGAIRQAELAKFAIENDAIFSFSDDASAFRLPSGTFARNFLRVGNLLAKQSVLNSFFFWLLPHLREAESILVETWSIGALLHNCARLLQLYDPKKNQRLRVEMLSKYHDSAAQSSQNTRIAIRRVLANKPRELLVLTSASMTRQSLNRLRATIAAMPDGRADHLRFLTAYKLTKEVQTSHLCDLSREHGIGSFEPLELSPRDLRERHVVDIDAKTYFPSVRKDNPLRITRDLAMLNHRFYADYGHTRAICIHRDNKEGDRPVRHHAYYVDVEQLLDVKRFQSKLRTSLSVIQEPPICIVVPRHSAGTALAKVIHGMLTTRMKVAVPVYVDGSLSKPEDVWPEAYSTSGAGASVSLAERISQATTPQRILVVDDVTIRGVRLANYRRKLRILNFAGLLDFVIGVARPADRQEWETRVSDLTLTDSAHRNRLIAVDFVVLPDWDRTDCPWCAEQQLITMADPLGSNGSEEARGSRELRRRAALLASAPINRGLSREVMWTKIRRSEAELTNGSIFLPKRPETREAAVFAAVASSIQEMRTRSRRKLESRFPLSTVIDGRMYLGGRFNDAILKAAIVRASHAHELTCTAATGEQNRRDLLDVLMETRAEGPCLNIEVGLASALGKLPHVGSASQTGRRVAAGAGGAVAAALLKVRDLAKQ